MNINVNLRPKKGLFKKIIIIILFSFLCFFIKEKVFAIDKINLYDFISDSKFDKTTFNYITNYPNLLDKFYFPFSSNNPEMIAEQTQPKDFLEYPLANGYNYYLILYKNGSFSGMNGPKYDERRLILLFKDIPKGQLISDTCSVFMTTPSYKNSCSKLKFLNISDFLEIETVSNKTAFSAYYFNNDWTITVTNSTVDTNTGSSVEEFTYTSYASNFDFYLTDGTKLVGASDIYYEFPKEDVSKGIFDTIKDIFNTIIELPGKIINGIGNFFNDLLTGIKNFLKDLFIPDKEIFEDFINQEYDYLKEKLGFLIYPVELLSNFINRFNNLSNSQNAVFNIPTVSFMGVTIINQTSFDLLSLVNSSESLKNLYSIYRIFVSGLIVVWLCLLAKKKYDETFGGGK